VPKHPHHHLVALVVAAATAGCVGSKPQPEGRVPDRAAPAPAAYVAYPEAEVAGLKSPHDYKGKPLCQRCHAPDLALAAEPNALCTGCHKQNHRNHPVNVVQKGGGGDLPLLAGGKVACHSCHDPHRAKAPLRKQFNALCKDCHRGH
jgi:predicted CXXCH cytochrome family protein